MTSSHTVFLRPSGFLGAARPHGSVQGLSWPSAAWGQHRRTERHMHRLGLEGLPPSQACAWVWSAIHHFKM